MVTGVIIPADETLALSKQEFNDLHDYQRAVGGLIEAIDLDFPAMSFFANDEAKLIGLPINRRATILWWLHSPIVYGYDVLAGDAVLIGRPDQHGDTQSAPAEFISLLMEKVRYMKQVPAKQLGEYIQKNRVARGLSGREFARQIGVDTAYVVRLERGEYKAPRPDTLKNVAEALKLPLSDVYAVAGYVVPCDLPSLIPYLRTRYGQLSDEAITALDSYFLKIADSEGLDLNGPAPGEDETPFTRPEDIDPDDLK